mmetsp:Transcript_35777/g.70382  ORF Transcript_35777/g.70382 Transcript_35777/m.70382 type:complete len:212 (-) Transcript_35777:1979-2614(-)
MLITALFSRLLLKKRIRKAQGISLLLLTVGVVLCNYQPTDAAASTSDSASRLRGLAATLGIAVASGFAAVYTERVLKAERPVAAAAADRAEYSLAYMQVQLASVSLVVMGTYAVCTDHAALLEHGLWHNFSGPAFLSVANSGLGGLMVAAVLKYADAVLKGYATAVSVVLTGFLSMLLFGTTLSVQYLLGIVNVIIAVILYNAKDLDRLLC